jgi:hypothetical protein
MLLAARLVAHRAAVFVLGGLREDAAQFDLASALLGRRELVSDFRLAEQATSVSAAVKGAKAAEQPLDGEHRRRMMERSGRKWCIHPPVADRALRAATMY